MDDPDYAQGQAETHRSVEETKKPEPKGEDDDMEGDMEEAQEDEELDEDGNPIPKKVEKVVV